MKLRYVRIKNFRSAHDIELSIKDFLAFVGANNSGKSNILRALNFLFNPSTKLIDEECFWNLDTGNEISIEAIFTDLLENEIREMGPYLKPDGSFHMIRTINYSPHDSSDEFSDGKIAISQKYLKFVPIYNWLRQDQINGTTITEWWNNRDELIVRSISFSDFVGGNQPNVGQWKEHATQYIDRYLVNEDFKAIWVDNPKGYAGVLKSSLPNFIFIPAVQEVSDQAKVTSTSPFGQLVNELIKNISDAQKEEVNNFLSSIDSKLNRTGGKERIQSIRDTETRMNDVLSTYMPVDLEIEFQSPTIESLLSSPRLFADDGFRNSVENKGHGLQRAIIFSILQSYSELITELNNGNQRTTIFGIEEPEIYMHPQAQRNLRNVFSALTKEKDQILITTHSPNFIDVIYFDEIVRAESSISNDEVKNKVWQLEVEDLVHDLVTRKPELKGKVSSDSIRERYSHAYHPNRSEGFFANKIILVEGATEQYSLPIYANAYGMNLEKDNIAIVDCGGKGQIDRLYRIFNELGIPCYVVFDYDKSSIDKESIRTSKSLLEFLGCTPESPEDILCTEKFTCFPETFESHVYKDIESTNQLRTEARQTLGLRADSGKPLVARFIANKLVSRDEPIIPEPIKGLLENGTSTIWAGTCLHTCD